MDSWEITKVVFERVHALDPENASKIVGMLLIHDNSENEMIRLAFGPEDLLHSFVARARAELAAKPLSPSSAVLGPSQVGRLWRMASSGGEHAPFADSEALYPDEYDCWSPVAGRHRPPQLMESAFPFSPSPRGLNFLLQQQQQHSEPQRSAAMLLGGEDLSMLAVRSPRMDRVDFMTNASRQIYLTFPADSTFSEEDVSNYFSVYGPVQGVRIPYHQKRMFGFVTFVYPESVEIILSKGNPHFVCGARVLVKPYKDKGKVPNRIRKLQPPNHAELPGCITPTVLHDPKDPFNMRQPQIGPKMMLGDVSYEAFMRRKIEEQQQAADLQRAIELQDRRFMGLQLLDLKNGGHHLGSPIGSPMYFGQTDGNGNVNGNGNAAYLEDVTVQDSKLNGSSLAMLAPAFSTLSEIAAEGKHEDQQKAEDGDGTPKQAVNPGEEKKRESGPLITAPNVACGFQGSAVDHNLPESLLGSIDSDNTGVIAQNGNISPHHVASSLLPPTSSLICHHTTPASFKCPGSLLGMKPLGCE